jgi:hypothetical protein
VRGFAAALLGALAGVVLVAIGAGVSLAALLPGSGLRTGLAGAVLVLVGLALLVAAGVTAHAAGGARARGERAP